MLVLDLGDALTTQVEVGLSDHTGKLVYDDSWTDAGEFIRLDLNAIGLEPGLYFVQIKQAGHPLRITRLVKH